MVFRRLRKEKHFSGFRHGANGMALGVGVVYQKWKRRATVAVQSAFLMIQFAPFRGDRYICTFRREISTDDVKC